MWKRSGFFLSFPHDLEFFPLEQKILELWLMFCSEYEDFKITYLVDCFDVMGSVITVKHCNNIVCQEWNV